ncbi:DUF4097 family beta strand repeat-containing protein [Streptomyces tropicalis]|uniref:DUF4097 family beta strand repeat-containing protein n=1 Tax=Streptomyces tropicalis TaxID=3034234 RepID=A0ABT5ZY44_9ACTN|nr:DUF4097 family beta strand repeat-containing protein [Streptomyces tropicalis]MDF3297326.1 DUF4097 family beta strand repeat-containing protein [Streptomyces tropicalis]
MSRTVPVRALALAGAVAVLAAGATACGASADDDRHPDHRSFALTGRTLTVDSDDSALEVVTADTGGPGTVRVTRWFEGSTVVGGTPRTTWTMDGDRLVLRMTCSGVLTSCSARHRIEVPRGVAVKVEDGDGSVLAQGFAEPLTIRTGDGAVHVRDTSGPVDLTSGDGSVRAEVTSRRVRVVTADGGIDLELGAVPDRVDSQSGDGSVTVALPRAVYRVSTASGDGTVRVGVPRDDTASHVVSVRSGDGDITVRTAN